MWEQAEPDGNYMILNSYFMYSILLLHIKKCGCSTQCFSSNDIMMFIKDKNKQKYIQNDKSQQNLFS